MYVLCFSTGRLKFWRIPGIHGECWVGDTAEIGSRMMWIDLHTLNSAYSGNLTVTAKYHRSILSSLYPSKFTKICLGGNL